MPDEPEAIGETVHGSGVYPRSLITARGRIRGVRIRGVRCYELDTEGSPEPRARLGAPMSAPPRPAPNTPIAIAVPPDGYVPGVCNIGPWEIRRRRAYALAGFVIAAALLLGLVVVGAPTLFRLLVLLPAWGGMFSWLQARRRFCAAFAMAGISNFADGDEGRQAVADPEARKADARAVMRLTRDSFLVAVAVTAVAVLLPV